MGSTQGEVDGVLIGGAGGGCDAVFFLAARRRRFPAARSRILALGGDERRGVSVLPDDRDLAQCGVDLLRGKSPRKDERAQRPPAYGSLSRIAYPNSACRVQGNAHFCRPAIPGDS